MNDTLLSTIEYIEWVRAIAVFLTAICVMSAYYCRKKYIQCIAASGPIYHTIERYISDLVDSRVAMQIERFEKQLMKELKAKVTANK